MLPIYLDYNATTPIDREVADTMKPFLKDFFGNPSSSHWYGVQARRAVENARNQVAELLGADPEEIIFTSGGSEANNMAIKGAALAARGRGNHIITTAIEHPAVMEVCHYLEGQGFRVTYLPVDSFGRVAPDEVERAITPETVLISVMHANNEVGTIQPVAEIAALARRHGVLVHTDAAQSVGKIPVRVDELGVDLLSVAGHKLYAPKGVGALYVRRGVNLERLIHGAAHEQGRRAGTENVLEIAGLGKACELAGRHLDRHMARMRHLRDRLYQGLQERLGDGVRLNGHPELRLPNTLSLGFRRVEANTLLAEIGERVAASAGAACHAEVVDVSPVLEAMHVPLEYAMGTVRFSTGRPTTEEEIDQAVDIIAAAVERMDRGGEAPGVAISGAAVRLTRFTHGMGCACKLRPQALEAILAHLPTARAKEVLVGTETADDAAVYRLDDTTALVVTVDFFTPIVDDPYDFGAIAAANALSDVYAMGGRPLLALSIVGFPTGRLPLEVLTRILEGARDKTGEAGVPIIGGHSIEDTEPKYGLAVVGTVPPDRVLTNAGARPGDALILTKPLGTGIIATAVKTGLADAHLAAEAIRVMAGLNKVAAEVMSAYPVNACTDVTGFGLLGHLLEMTRAAAVDAEVEPNQVPVIAAVRDLVRQGSVPGGTLGNLDHVAPYVDWGDSVGRTDRLVLCDAQTSGGLLIAVPAEHAAAMIGALCKMGVADAAVIGRITGPGTGRIRIGESRLE